MSDEIKLGDIVVFKTDNRAFEVIGKYIVPDDRLWRVEAITEDDPPTPDRNRKYRLVAVDCPNVMLDEIPEIYVESYSEKLERELEEQRKEALKMKRNEIKQGDKVKVSEDAPKVYMSSVNNLFKYHVCKVEETDGDSAKIRYTDIGIDRWLAIPTKYLVKVDAEAKEAKFKVGDKVIFIPTGKVKVVSRINANSQYAITEPNGQSPLCVRETELAPYIESNAPKFKVGDRVRNVKSDLCGIALSIEHGIVEVGIPYDKEKHYWNTDIVELVEPTQQTEAEKPNHTIKIPVEVDLTDSYWDAYAADLAKEVALKVANKYNDPKEAAEYAVLVAKAVVEGLKRK